MRLKTQAEKQAQRAAATPPRYYREFARKQWRKSCGDMFRYRNTKLAPSFVDFLTLRSM